VLILSLYNLIICSVAVVLYVAVDEFEPNRRFASALRMIVSVAVGVGAIFSQFDAIASARQRQLHSKGLSRHDLIPVFDHR